MQSALEAAYLGHEQHVPHRLLNIDAEGTVSLCCRCAPMQNVIQADSVVAEQSTGLYQVRWLVLLRFKMAI